MAGIKMKTDRWNDASADLEEALSISTALADTSELQLCLQLAGVWSSAHNAAMASQLLGAADALATRIGVEPVPAFWSGLLADARQKIDAAIGLDATRRTGELGRAMTLDDAINLGRLSLEKTPRSFEDAIEISLSPLERQLLALLGEGHTDSQIGERLSMSTRTVRSRLERIRRETACRSRAALARLATEHHLGVTVSVVNALSGTA
jgi:DNA-binding CsgD family transcriptional regulator